MILAEVDREGLTVMNRGRGQAEGSAVKCSDTSFSLWKQKRRNKIVEAKVAYWAG